MRILEKVRDGIGTALLKIFILFFTLSDIKKIKSLCHSSDFDDVNIIFLPCFFFEKISSFLEIR